MLVRDLHHSIRGAISAFASFPGCPQALQTGDYSLMARPVTKFANVTARQRRQLNDFYRNHPLPSHRRRAHAMLLSEEGYAPSEIADILHGHPDTVRRWIDQFNQDGIAGIVDLPRPGGEPLLDQEQQQALREIIDQFPNQPRRVLDELEQATGQRISRATLRRYCHRLNLSWKRFRKSSKHRRDEKAFRRAKKEIAKLVQSPNQHVIYFDEAAMTLRGVVPYGWQPIGQRGLVPVSGSSYPSLQLFGFQRPDGSVRCYFHKGRVSTDTVTDVIDHFVSHLRRPATLVLDNASVHTSGKFNSRMEHWEEKGLSIYRIPPYSPELNLIERFWQKLKYQWMPTTAWDEFIEMLDAALECIEKQGRAYLMPSLQHYPA